MNGPEMMLRSLGLGEVLEGAKKLAEAGTVEKILKFADELEGLRNDIGEIKRRLGIGEPAIIDGTARDVTTDPGSRDSDAA